jgi:predicted metal-dependent hydrolase
VLGEKVLLGQLIPKSVDPELRKVWVWHSLEEIDHKAVAMDLFLEVGGTWLQRVRGMLYTFTGFWWDATIRMLHMLKRDGLLRKPRTWWQIAELFLGSRGVLRPILGDILKFFSPRFHPARHDNYGLVAEGRQLLKADLVVGSF